MGEIITTGGILHENDYADILKTICEVFECSVRDITDFKPLQKGLTNIVLQFCYNGGKYVFRHPGLGSDALVDRGRESIVQKQIEEVGVDKTLIVMSVDQGWRISKFIQNRPFDYHNLNDVVRAMLLLRELHSIKPKVRWNFDVMDKINSIVKIIPEKFYGSGIEEFKDFSIIKERAEELYRFASHDDISKCLTHGDCRDENFLINDEEIYLIDWEYAGYGDPGFDIGSYVCGGLHSEKEINQLLFIYFGRTPSAKEKRHYYAYIALTGYFYMHWTMYKESCGQTIGYLKKNWYHYAKEYSKKALQLYSNGGKTL